jgi:hypothetical protein
MGEKSRMLLLSSRLTREETLRHEKPSFAWPVRYGRLFCLNACICLPEWLTITKNVAHCITGLRVQRTRF